jgi:1,4-alpha-glucan branching enzyme
VVTSALPHTEYRAGLSNGRRWREVIYTDEAIYVGSGVGNMGCIDAVS